MFKTKTTAKKKSYFVNFVIGYFPALHAFAPYQNYYLYPSLLAEEMGYSPIILIRFGEEYLRSDPNLSPGIKIIVYKNVLQFLIILIKYSLCGSLFYINNHGIRSYIALVVTGLLRRPSIFMGHIQPKRTTKLKQLIFNVVLFFTRRIRLNNSDEEKFLINEGISSKKLFVVPIAVNERAFTQTEFDYAKRINIVYYGNMTTQKGLPTIFEALSLLKEKVPNILLHIVGSRGNYRPEGDIKKFDVEDQVIFHGEQRHGEKLNHLLNNTRVFVISTKAEGQCMAVYEAALTGNALCLPEIMSFRSVFKDKALFHELGDAKKLSENMYTYLTDTEKIKRDVELCQKMIHTEYSEETIKERFQKLLTF